VKSSSLRSVVFAKDAQATLLQNLLPPPVVLVRTRDEFATAVSKRSRVAFVSAELLDQLDGARIPIVTITDYPRAEALAETVHLLDRFPGISHVIGAGVLAHPHAKQHLDHLLDRLAAGPEPNVSLLGSDGIGRCALIARASRREARFERMREFFAKQDVSPRTIGSLLEVAEELVMNALYDAPAEGGYFVKPRERVEDVELPSDLACEIGYGIENEVAFVRLRDPFGALARRRMTQVLGRCASTGADVRVDSSRGGAGLGLWRVFRAASMVSITVIPGSLTEFLVGIRLHEGRVASKQIEAVHLFFASRSEEYESFTITPEDSHGLVDQSITLTLVA
jgi:hypothetical protein